MTCITDGLEEIETAAQVLGAAEGHAFRLTAGEQHDDAALNGVCTDDRSRRMRFGRFSDRTPLRLLARGVNDLLQAFPV